MTTSIEMSIICTVMSSDMLLDKERKDIENVEIKEDWFTNQNHKILVKIINALRRNNKPTNMEMVRYYAVKNGYILDDLIVDIMCLNGFGTFGTFESYIDLLKQNKKQNLQDLI